MEVAIIGLEGQALKLGSTVATHAVKSWLRRRKAQFERGASLAEIAQAELKSPLQQRKLENLVDRIGQQVAEQLAPVLERRFAELPSYEAEAAIHAVIDALKQVDLSDKTLLSADADAEVLAKRIRAQVPQRAILLSSQAEQLHELALDQACRHLVQVIRYLPSFQPAALVETLRRLTAQSEQLELLLSRVPTTTLYAPHGIDHDDEFRVEYLSMLARTLDQLSLLGLPGDKQPTLALTVAYLSLSVSGNPDRSRRRGRVQREVWFDPQERRDSRHAEGLPVESAIGRGSRVLLRGDAGSGKTTLLNWLAVRAAREELSGALADWNDCIPFVIRLRAFSEGELPAPERFVVQCTPLIAEVMPEGWVHRMLRAGRGMLLVDGVDEVPASRRRLVKNWLNDLLVAFPATRVVVTARTAAADSKWLAEQDFGSVDLEPMNPGNILDFVDRWHHAAELSGADVADAERRMRGQLERPHLRQLAASPLLCAMLCALNLAHLSELPRNRMELYAKALAMLLHLRDAERGIAGLLGDTEKRVLLRDLAWRLTLANKVEFPTREVLEHITRKLPGMPNVDIEPQGILVHLLERSGVLREPVPGRVDFVHRTFLEYLAADEAIQQHHVDTLIAHAHQDTWWETIVMACGHATTTQAGQLLTGILDRADQDSKKARHLRLLAAACLETVRDIAPEVSSRVDSMVRRRLVPPRSMAETASLTTVGHRIIRYLPEALGHLSEAKAIATVRVAALAGTSDALPRLASYAQDRRSAVQYEIQRAWRYFDPERFAQIVLAESPLEDGKLTVYSRKHIPYIKYVRAVTSLFVTPDWYEYFDGLELLVGLPALKVLRAPLRDDVTHDLRLLGEHSQLRSLQIEGLGETRDISPLAELENLRSLLLGGYADESLAAAPELVNVSSVTLFPQSAVSSEAKNIARVFRFAESLNLSNFDPLDLKSIARMGRLKSLMLQNSTFDSLAPLVQLKALRNLDVSNNVNFDYDLTPLVNLELETLTLDRNCSYSGEAGNSTTILRE